MRLHLGFFGRFLAAEEKPVSAKIIRNVLFSGLQAMLVWPVPFLLIPFILGKVGLSGYGTWAVFLAIINLTSLADLGLGGTLTKHVAAHYAREDLKTLSRLIATGLILYSVIAFLVILVLWVGSANFLQLLFRGSPVPRSELRVLWHYLLVIIGINMLTVPFYSVITGLQRMDLSSILGSFSVLFSAFLTVVFLGLGWELRGLVYANLAAASLTLLIYVRTVRSLLPELTLDPLHSDWGQIKDIFSFSLRMYLTQVAVAIHNQVEKLYLALLVGVVSVGWYHVASEVALKIRRIPELLLTPILAAASELDARGDRQKLTELYYRCHKYLALMGVPLVLYVVAVSKRLVDIWLGPKLSVVAIPLSVLVLVNFFNLTSGPGWLILIGQAFLTPGVYSALAGIVLNVFLSFVLIHSYGFSGAIIGTSFSLVIATALFIYLFHRHTGNPYGRLIREAYLKPVACSLLILAMLRIISPLDHLGWGGLVVHGVVFGVVYVLSLLLTRFFDPFDLAQVESLYPGARIVRRIIPFA